MQLTEHFADSELGVAGCDPRLVLNATALCNQVLEGIHAKFGTVRVHDGYRDPGHNGRVGGKATSFHLFTDGRSAADVDAPAVTIPALFDWLRLESKLSFDKVIMEMNTAEVPACVHIQVDRLNPSRRQAFIGHTGAATVYTPVEVR
jgi:hypothetical protein